MMKTIRLLSLLWLTISALPALGADITASVNRNPVSIDESFSLTLRASGTVDEDPDLSPLTENFEVLSTSQSTSMNYTNGNFSRTSTWNIELISKHVGVINIPSISFGKDNSPSLRLTVNDAGSGQQAVDKTVYIEVEADVEETWVQAQIIISVKLFHSVSINSASLSDIETSDSDAIMEKLGDDKSYESFRDGVRYNVIERRYAIYPQNTGKLTIKPVRFEARIGGSTRSLFNPYAGGKRKRVLSDPLEINIRPAPANTDMDEWLPAERVQLQQEWSLPIDELQTGEPVTRTITIAARGLLANQLPDISPDEISSVKQYPDKPVLSSKYNDSGVISSKQIKIAMIPAYAGSYSIPEIRIPWWNTKSGEQEIVTLPATEIKVSGEAKAVKETTPSASVSATDDVPMATGSVETDTATTISDAAGSDLWRWISLMLAAGWILTVILFMYFRNNADSVTKPVSVKKLLAILLQSCSSNDAVASKNALLDWAKANWPQQRIYNLMDIVGHIDEASAHAIRELNSALYSGHTENWRGDRLADAIKHAQRAGNDNEKSEKDLLEPLYKS